jgi:hypothetical protein
VKGTAGKAANEARIGEHRNGSAPWGREEVRAAQPAHTSNLNVIEDIV